MKKQFAILIGTVACLFLVLWLAVSELMPESTEGSGQQAGEALDEAVRQAALDHYAWTYADNEKVFEVHKIYGTEESQGKVRVYIWSLMAGFNRATGNESQMAHSVPAVVTLKKQGSMYKAISYAEPEDGEGWGDSVSKLFPDKYVKEILHDAGNGDKKMQSKMDGLVNAWLSKEN